MNYDKPRINDSIYHIWKKDKWIPIGSVLYSTGAVFGYKWYLGKYRKNIMTPGSALSYALFGSFMLALVGGKMRAIQKEGHLDAKAIDFN